MQDEKQDTKENEPQEQLPTWKKPVIMHIELKRTMFFTGSALDCATGSVGCPTTG